MLIAGVDEVGRGSLAGPVVAASCILPADLSLPGLADSKALSPRQRDVLYERLVRVSIAWAVAEVCAADIDRLNIRQAALTAMRLAVHALPVRPHGVLVDGRDPLQTAFPEQAIIDGDARSPSIAAASIIAKVTRDRMMAALERRYPHFSFSVHKGYGTRRHSQEIRAHGPTPLHRLTFRGVKLP